MVLDPLYGGSCRCDSGDIAVDLGAVIFHIYGADSPCVDSGCGIVYGALGPFNVYIPSIDKVVGYVGNFLGQISILVGIESEQIVIYQQIVIKTGCVEQIAIGIERLESELDKHHVGIGVIVNEVFWGAGRSAGCALLMHYYRILYRRCRCPIGIILQRICKDHRCLTRF